MTFVLKQKKKYLLYVIDLFMPKVLVIPSYCVTYITETMDKLSRFL